MTLDQLRSELHLDSKEQVGLPRRIRELRDYGYQIGYDPRRRAYFLDTAEPAEQKADTDPVPGKLWADIILAAHGRCQMCGKTITKDKVTLQVDHRVPRSWGGKPIRDILWAICIRCNVAKRDFFATFDASLMRKCMHHKEPIRRIGELLKALQGQIVSRQLLEVVGEDEQWTRRLRELRELGWNIEMVMDSTKSGRHKYVYRLVESKPWPENIGEALREHRSGVRKRKSRDA